MKFKSLDDLQSYKNKSEAPLRGKYIVEGTEDIEGFFYPEGITYSKTASVDGHEFKLQLSIEDKHPENAVFSFEGEHDEALVNAGLATFRRLVQHMRLFVLEIKEKCGIKYLVIEGGSKYSLTKEATKKLHDQMRSKLNENVHVFDGLHFEQGDNAMKIEHGNYLELIPELVKKWGVNGSWSTYNLLPPQNFEILINAMATYGAPLIQEICSRIYDELPKDLEKALRKPADQQRMNLYRRTLKNMFPNLEVTELGSKLVVNIESLQ